MRPSPRQVVGLAAAAAFALRLPGLTRPIRPDEAGFLLVAEHWRPQPDSMFGPYWVDRPPLLIAVVKASDAIGGSLFLRLLGALACGLLVLAAAQVARLVADERAAAWTAVAVAALTTNTLIDAVAVKGELLGIPIIMGSFSVILLALRRRSTALAFGAGLLAALPLGFKQNLAAGLVFGAVLLLASWLTGRITRRDLGRLGGAAAAGAAVPVVATVAWAWWAGVHLHTLWYAVFGFRSDAARVIALGSTTAPVTRAWLLVLVALGAGMALMIGGFLVHLRSEWAEDREVTAATLAVLLVDGLALAAGGSYWRDYLFPLIPGTALCAALLAHGATTRGRAMRGVIAAAAVSSVACMLGWIAWNVTSQQEFHEVDTGEAVARAAHPGDSLVVFGGRADLQYSSGLPSPYPYLWSLPMRTLDPTYARLTALLEGPDAPTWLVEWVEFDAWGNPHAGLLEKVVHARYDERGTGCDGRRVYVLRGVERLPVEPDCG